jgi:plasmid stabilization system protein ParE
MPSSIDPTDRPAPPPGEPSQPAAQGGRLQRWVRLGQIAVTLVVLLVIGAGLAGRWAWQATRKVPDFYRQAVAVEIDPQQAERVSRELETEVEQLTDNMGRAGRWRATFSEREINAWLIHQLPQEFSRAMPKGVEDPRVAITEEGLRVAARYRGKRIETVVSCRLEVQLTEEPNLLAIHIRDLKAGALPLPLSRFVDHVSRRAARDGLQVRWDTDGGDQPIALVSVPSEHPRFVCTPVVVESVRIGEGEVTLSGQTGPDAQICYQPQTAIYRLASARPAESDERPEANEPAANQSL